MADQIPEELENNGFMRLLGKSVERTWTPDKLSEIYNDAWTKISQKFCATSSNASFEADRKLCDLTPLQNFGDWRTKYDGKIKTQDDLNKALEKMVDSLDNRWTQYVPPKPEAPPAASPLEASTQPDADETAESAEKAPEKAQVSMGIMASQVSDGSYEIYHLFYGTGGYNSALRKGDHIQAIDGQALKDLKPEQVEALLAAPEGTARTVEFSHDGQTEKDTINFTAPPKEQSTVEIRDDNILYVRPPQFDPALYQQFKSKLAEVFAKADHKPDGIVLDLRGNIGGYDNLAPDAAALFIRNGIMARRTTRDGRSIQTQDTYIADPLPYQQPKTLSEVLQSDTLLNAKLAVLANSSTGSSAEVLLQAIQGRNRGTFIGTNTMGKSTGYYEQGLENGGLLRVAEGSYVTLDGRSWNEVGLTPDVRIEQPRHETKDVAMDAALEFLKRK